MSSQIGFTPIYYTNIIESTNLIKKAIKIYHIKPY